MPVTIVLGAQFGDEGKGKIADFLSADASMVIRSGGGPNTGHTIHLPDGQLVLHQLACGVLRKGCLGISGPGMVLNPLSVETEIEELSRRGLLKGEVVLSDRAHAILPLHELEDAWEERIRTSKDPSYALGTTRRGIGPAYEDRYGRWGVRLADLSRPAELRSRLELLYESKRHIPGLPPIDAVHASLSEAGQRLAPYIRPTEPLVWGALDRGESVLIEGAQSALLDVDFGTYPYVTSSHPTSAGALAGSGIPPQELDRSIGVLKAYSTRVGGGPFPTEETGEMGDYLQREGGETGASTGRRRRCGWLDLVLLRYASRLNGFTELAITKVDVLGGLDEIPVCVRYASPTSQTIDSFPPSSSGDLAAVTPIYERLPGWPRFHQRIRDQLRQEGAKALPSNLRRFLSFIARTTGAPVRWVSYGPSRSDTIEVRGREASEDPRASGLSGWRA